MRPTYYAIAYPTKARTMHHSMVAVQKAADDSATDESHKLWCDLLLLHLDRAGITSTSLKDVLGLKWRTIRKRLRSGTADYDEVKLLLRHCGIDPWLSMIAVDELRRPEAYFDASIAWTAESAQHIVRTILERLNALNGDFIPLRRGLNSQAARLVDELFAQQRRFQEFTA